MSETDPAELDEIIAEAQRMQAEAREIDPASLGPEDVGPEWFEAAAAAVQARRAAEAVAALPPAPVEASPPPPLSSGAVWGFAVALVALLTVCGAGVSVLVGATEVQQAQQRVERTAAGLRAAVDTAARGAGQHPNPSQTLAQQAQALGPDAVEVARALSEWHAAQAALEDAASHPPGSWARAFGLVDSH